jgi:hypothetical protein
MIPEPALAVKTAHAQQWMQKTSDPNEKQPGAGTNRLAIPVAMETLVKRRMQLEGPRRSYVT